MFLSTFDLFKVGIGPSSSHTMGPMVAASLFLNSLKEIPFSENLRIRVTLYGSLAFTGKGHATDRAVILGLLGQTPETIDIEQSEILLKNLEREKCISLNDGRKYFFDSKKDLIFDYVNILLYHTNGLSFELLSPENAVIFRKNYYSIGGGFVVCGDDIDESVSYQDSLQNEESITDASELTTKVPYPFRNAKEMLSMAKKSSLSIAQMKRANEETFLTKDQVNHKLDFIWEIMKNCIERGLSTKGILPGGLNVSRRAPGLYQKLLSNRKQNENNPFIANDWLSLFALSVNEENAAGGQVVTAPTNGAAGVIPAVIQYYLHFYSSHLESENQEKVRDFLLTAAAIGGLIKSNASISGAEVGCQGEVGSASSMAAAGLVEILGGTPEQIENAAEIALEHHLGLTCDPVAGLVQVPCIERNAFGAVKSVTAASLSMYSDGQHFVPLDICIETMRQTGVDMASKYKETSQGGLAINISVNRTDC